MENKNIYLGINCISMRNFEFNIPETLRTWISLNLMNINRFDTIRYLPNWIGTKTMKTLYSYGFPPISAKNMSFTD